MSDHTSARPAALDAMLQHAERRAAAFGDGALKATPLRGVTIVTCMDARIDPAALLGLAPGDAHVIRNAGGVVGDGELRSLAVSQRLLGTTEIAVILHTDCGVRTFTDEDFKDELEAETGTRPSWPPVTFGAVEDDVRATLRRILDDPFLPHKKVVRGFVYDVGTGRLREVVLEG
jgi:carbonic anhydrase